MITAISKYMPRWLMAIIATALVLATLVGSSQDSAEAIDPADTDTVYIADGTNFADALMGATIAALNTSPMLGVAGTNGGDTIPGDTIEELDRLTNNKADLLDTIYIFGGTSAVSADVQIQLEEWANDVQRIQGDSRWGTYEAISQMLPSMIDEAAHAQEADNADTLDGNDSTDFLGATDKAADSELLDGMDSTDFALSDQSCATGQVVTGIAADGTPVCSASVNGVTTTKVQLQDLSSGTVAEQEIFSGNGLVISASCSTGLENIFVETTIDNSEISSVSQNAGDGSEFNVKDDDFDTSDKLEITNGTPNDTVYDVAYQSSDGQVVTAQLSTEGPTSGTCEIGGFVTHG